MPAVGTGWQGPGNIEAMKRFWAMAMALAQRDTGLAAHNVLVNLQYDPSNSLEQF
jgi:hypothetical protein